MRSLDGSRSSWRTERSAAFASVFRGNGLANCRSMVPIAEMRLRLFVPTRSSRDRRCVLSLTRTVTTVQLEADRENVAVGGRSFARTRRTLATDHGICFPDGAAYLLSRPRITYWL